MIEDKTNMDIRRSLLGFYWKVRAIVAPTLQYSQYFYEDVLNQHVNRDVAWLDLGCGHQILPDWREEEERRLVRNCKMVVGIDYDSHSLKNHKNILHRVRGGISKLPFANNSFDLVTANMVVEHLDNPSAQFQEVSRVLKPEGLFIFHTPNAFGYPSILTRLAPNSIKDKIVYFLDGRKEEDIFETHYKANTRKSISNLSRTIGFEVAQIRMIATDAIFASLPPLVIPELIWIRILMTKPFKSLRTNIIAILKKRPENEITPIPRPGFERTNTVRVFDDLR